ncbi:4-hydroxy-tetrahydrodipicolinate synthase [Chloroflexota bacterium]
MSDIGRVLTAMVTPFTDSGEVNYDQAKKLAAALIKCGSDGLIIAGTTGESPTLLREEEYRLFREIKQTLGDGGSVVAGTGSNSTTEAITATKEAEKIGVDACLLVVPYYNKPTQEGLYQHFKAIAESTSLPCILYNVPSRTVAKLNADTIVRLSQIDNIVGIKEASGDMGLVAEVISRADDDFLLWSGNDNDTFHIMTLGGYGVISVSAHLVGLQTRSMIENIISGNLEEAAATHRYLLPLIDSLFVVSNPVPVKFALNHIGFNVGSTRLPLVDMDEATAAIVRDSISRYPIDLPLD